jgi:hypothetical protein
MDESQEYLFKTVEPFFFRNKEWHCSIRFSEDRIEYTWNAWGLDAETGKKAFVRSELGRTLGDYSGSSPLRASYGRLPGTYLVLAMFSYALLPLPWRYSTYVFLAFFAVSLVQVLRSLRRRDWIKINTSTGNVAVAVQVTKWSSDERDRFRRSYCEFMKMPNQSTDPALASGTPAAGQPARHP